MAGPIHDQDATAKRTIPRYMRSAPIRPIVHPVDQSIALSFALSVLFVAVAIVTGLPVVAGLSLLLPVAYLLRCACAGCCACSRGNTHLVPALDAFWLPGQGLRHYTSHCLLFLEGSVPVPRLRELLASRLIHRTGENGKRAFARFTQRVALAAGGYCWIEDQNFAIENHVFGESKVGSRRKLRRYLGYLMGQPLPAERPLWQVRVLEPSGRLRETILVVRVHHALSDGISLVKLLSNVLSDGQLRLKPRFGGTAFPLNVFRALVVGPLTFVGWLLCARRDYNYFRHGQPFSGDRVVAWSDEVRYGKIYRIKQVTRSTINDVLLSAVAGSVRTYFRRHGIQHPPNVMISMPVDLRYEPSSPETSPQLGTGYALVSTLLPTNVEGAIPRLWEVRHLMEDVKTSADPVVMYGAINMLLGLLPQSFSCWLVGLIQRTPSLAFCNLPGPEEPLVLASHRVTRAIFWMAARPEIPVSFSVLSYAGGFHLAVSADRDVVPDCRPLVAGFVAQIEQLSRLLAKRRIPGENRRRSSFTAERRQEEIFKPPIQEIQHKLHQVQDELHEITQKLELAQRPEFACTIEYRTMRHAALCQRVEELKEEFSELLTELRRRKSMVDGSLLNNEDEEDLDGEMRRPRRRVPGARRASLTSVTALMSTNRPLTTPTTVHHSSFHCPSPDSVSSPDQQRALLFSSSRV